MSFFFTLRPDFSLSLFLFFLSFFFFFYRSSVSLSLAAGVARWAQYVRDLQQYEARVEDEQTAAGALQLVGRLQAQRRTRLQQYYSRHVGKMRHRGMCSAFAGWSDITFNRRVAWVKLARAEAKMRQRGTFSAFAGYVEKKHLYNIQRTVAKYLH